MDSDTITITAMTSADADFYLLLGPFLANRAVHAHVGGPVWDDEGKTWLVACGRNGAVAGFAAITVRGGLAHIESCYTVDGDEDLAARLVADAVRRAAPTPCAATVRKQHAGAYLKAGFTQVGETANFLKLARSGQ